MMRYLFPALLLLSACGAEAPAPVADIDALTGDHLWSVDESASSVTFTGTQEGEAFTGRFSEFDVQINLDPDDTTDGEIVAVIDLASATTGDAERDDALPTSDWFDVRNTPQAVFRSDDIYRSTDRAGAPTNLYTATGTLSLKGVTRPLKLGFTLDEEGEATRAVGSTGLGRNDFGVGSGAYDTDEWIAFPVQVDVEIVATPE